MFLRLKLECGDSIIILRSHLHQLKMHRTLTKQNGEHDFILNNHYVCDSSTAPTIER